MQMFSMTIKSNIADEIRRLGVDIQKQPLAVAKALTFTAQDVQKAERDEMQRVFDRPTPFTLTSGDVHVDAVTANVPEPGVNAPRIVEPAAPFDSSMM